MGGGDSICSSRLLNVIYNKYVTVIVLQAHAVSSGKLDKNCMNHTTSVQRKRPPSGRPQVVVASVRWCCCWPLLGGVSSPHWGGHRRTLPSEESPHSVKEVARSKMKRLAMMQDPCLYNTSTCVLNPNPNPLQSHMYTIPRAYRMLLLGQLGYSLHPTQNYAVYWQ